MIILKLLAAYLMVGVVMAIIYVLGAIYVTKHLSSWLDEFKELLYREIGKQLNITAEAAFAVLLVVIVVAYPYIIDYTIKHLKE